MCLSALGLTLLLMTSSAYALEPMPPIMKSLLKIFPEENGRFVDEPFGADPHTPDQAKQFFETFRVVVPTVDDLEKNLARLFAAAPDLPVKKITRYDKDPGAPGLPGFRGIWCQLEDEKQIGFTILTVNQNRFLIWAKMAYCPSLAVDSINQKARDQYARDVSQYLAGIDMKVPENDPPQASARGLPQEMELLPPLPPVVRNNALDPRYGPSNLATIRAWGLSGVIAFVPDSKLLDSIESAAPDTLWDNPDRAFIQHEFDPAHDPDSPALQTLSRVIFDSLSVGSYLFVMDRFGRVRFRESGGFEIGVPITTYFPLAPILTNGIFIVGRCCAYRPKQENVLTDVGTYFGPYFYSRYDAVALASASLRTDEHLTTIGHFLAVVRQLQLPIDPPHGIHVRKFVLPWN
jgi:hypothetical protein